MPYHNWTPTTLSGNLNLLSDVERKIVDLDDQSRSVWNLINVQLGLKDELLEIKVTPKAQSEMLDTLNWDPNDLKNFLFCLFSGRYQGSQWCYPQGSAFAIACDVYLMGFDRMKRVENQKFTIAYVKFSVIKNYIYVVSAHAEKPRNERK